MDASEIQIWLLIHATPLLFFFSFAVVPISQLCVWLALAWLLRRLAAREQGKDQAIPGDLSRALVRMSALAYAALLTSYALIIAIAFEWQWSPPEAHQFRFLANQDVLSLMMLMSEAALVPILWILARTLVPAMGAPKLIPPATRWLPTLALLGVLCAAFFLLPDMTSNEPTGSPSLISMLVPTGHLWVASLHKVVSVTLVPVVEELLFRGFLYDVFRRLGGVLVAMLFTTVAFAAMHGSVDRLPTLLIVGLALAMLREVSGTVGAPAVAHAAMNTSLIS